MRISDWSSDVCSSDLAIGLREQVAGVDQDHRDSGLLPGDQVQRHRGLRTEARRQGVLAGGVLQRPGHAAFRALPCQPAVEVGQRPGGRSEEHTSELQSLMRISYAVFCLKKKK